ncbi:putative copper metallochaperone [Vibrio variabilis]|uniref:Copper metallochaperone n=1 Tax=Vibrio variabilis TaxID=990271 RepID=A0ABQ0JGC7_9VIBR|nr:putative copper metallochaperone [Vibrio variabilis]
MNKKWIALLIVAFGLGVGSKVYLDNQQQKEKQALELAQLEQVSESILYGENGDPVEIFDQADPRTRIVYFGFTRCPDVCPTSLAMLAGALNQIDDETKSTLRPMFVSLDPERDAAEASAEYAHYFHPMIEGYLHLLRSQNL